MKAIGSVNAMVWVFCGVYCTQKCFAGSGWHISESDASHCAPPVMQQYVEVGSMESLKNRYALLLYVATQTILVPLAGVFRYLYFRCCLILMEVNRIFSAVVKYIAPWWPNGAQSWTATSPVHVRLDSVSSGNLAAELGQTGPKRPLKRGISEITNAAQHLFSWNNWQTLEIPRPHVDSHPLSAH